MRELPAGIDAVLLDFADAEAPWRHALLAADALRAAAAEDALTGVLDVVPTAETVLVQGTPGAGLDRLGIRRVLRAAGSTRPDTTDVTGPAAPSITVDVAYDGADLDDVAATLGVDPEQVVAAHTDTVWRVQFMGFAPGFGYLVPDSTAAGADPHDPTLDALRALGRRSESRSSVPAGSVAIAAGYSAVYPRSSPGGWNLLGTSTIDLWDVDRTPPATLAPGATVRFRAT
ncbi:allophanate hydrolase [Williamsia sp. Leaf354]|uniref:5-oxoprolinase subunit B family protein n=1 Tax=Williamsia sp. Leaf354 TaxID=1736349 RepID=UPI0006F85C59|nr:carboxyltransferase domain-containing protein [Williamsia sp. Leaf354]KQS00643.1 allophanate hydrolase [Williamsia sp. Leaf354]